MLELSCYFVISNKKRNPLHFTKSAGDPSLGLPARDDTAVSFHPIRDSTFSQIIRRHFDFDAVSG